MGERIGILGGTFNPPHLGHLVMALDALEAAGLDRVLFVPAAVPPHKVHLADIASAADRLEMTRLAVAAEPRFQVSDHEIRRGGISFTVDTVRALKAEHPGAELHLIIGGDTLRELPSWKSIDDILGLCRIVTVARPGFDRERMRPVLGGQWPDRLLAGVVAGHQVDISSTDLRARVAHGRTIRFLVPDAVAGYIAARKLYTT